MEIKEALNVLKLTEPFTQDDLRKAFRREMSANHPDNFSTESDEIQKHQIEIAQMLNEAREILTDHLRSNPYPKEDNVQSRQRLKERIVLRFSFAMARLIFLSFSRDLA